MSVAMLMGKVSFCQIRSSVSTSGINKSPVFVFSASMLLAGNYTETRTQL